MQRVLNSSYNALTLNVEHEISFIQFLDNAVSELKNKISSMNSKSLHKSFILETKIGKGYKMEDRKYFTRINQFSSISSICSRNKHTTKIERNLKGLIKQHNIEPILNKKNKKKKAMMLNVKSFELNDLNYKEWVKIVQTKKAKRANFSMTFDNRNLNKIRDGCYKPIKDLKEEKHSRINYSKYIHDTSGASKFRLNKKVPHKFSKDYSFWNQFRSQELAKNRIKAKNPSYKYHKLSILYLPTKNILEATKKRANPLHNSSWNRQNSMTALSLSMIRVGTKKNATQFRTTNALELKDQIDKLVKKTKEEIKLLSNSKTSIEQISLQLENLGN